MRRYLLLKVIPGAAFANVVINYAAGRALYAAGHPVPLYGATSVAGDTLVNAFLIGFFTWLSVGRDARMHARKGRVAGLGRTEAWLAWTRRRPLLSALACGALSVAMFGAPLVAALAWRGIDAMERDAFVLLKTVFSLVAGVALAIVAAWIAVAREPDTTRDPRWCREPGRPDHEPSYPCEMIDKGGVAITDREQGMSGTPTWQLVVRGRLDPAHVRVALADVVTRYPSLATKVQSLDAPPPVATKYRYARDPAFDVGSMFEVVDARAPGAIDAIEAEVMSRHLDPFHEPPMTLTLAVTGDDSCRLMFRQHHAIADGRAFIELLADFTAFLEHARKGTRPSAEALAPVHRRPHLDAIDSVPGKRLRYGLRGFTWLVGAAARGLANPVVPLVQNRGRDYSGPNGTVFWSTGDDVLDSWNAARKRLGVGLNSVLAASLFAANQRWHLARGERLGRTTMVMPMETRPRDGSYRSFANHLSSLLVEVDLGRERDPVAMARAIDAQVRAQRDADIPMKRLACDAWFVDKMTLEQIHDIVFGLKHPTHAMDFSNLIPLPFPKIEGEGWSADELRITTPVGPLVGVMVSALRYGGRVFFNFNYKARVVERAQVEETRDLFLAVMREIVDGAAS